MDKKDPNLFINFSVITAIKNINEELSKKTETEDLAVKFLKKEGSYDYDTAKYLRGIINNLKKTNSEKEIIKEIILFYGYKIHFFRYVQYGYLKILSPDNGYLTPNQKQCFMNVGLLKKNNGIYKIDDNNWWENLKDKSFEESNKKKQELGRWGHECSIEYEIIQLKKIGINEEPERKYLESDALGYDVLSWRYRKKKKIEIYIESKAKSWGGDNLKVDVSANQLKKAKEFPNNYYIYLWPRAKKWDFKIQPKPRIYGYKEMINSKREPKSYSVTLKKADKIETI